MSGSVPLRDPRQLRGRLLVLAPHPDDEVLGAGGTLAAAIAGGASARAWIATDGCAGLEGDARRERAALRQGESRRAGARLGLVDHAFAGGTDGGLGADFGLVAAVAAVLADFDPDFVFAPSPWERHPDHVALCAAACAALVTHARGRVLFYGVNAPVPADVLFETSAFAAQKSAALLEYASQDGAELARKSAALDQARTLDIPDPSIRAVEGFVERDAGQALEFLRRARHLESLTDAPAAPADEFAATAVISTWNKRADLCANLDALRAQTRPFAAIVVVDNASHDDTAAVVAARYPEVSLIVMPHSRFGACETFNLGFASAKTPLIAILDDDVVLPPEWLERTTERLRREPASTAIVSTEVIEPEMPRSYVESAHLARERYMSTFRGCASLARTHALREAGGYDERLYIYGNERDLTCRLLNLGYRVLQYPSVRAFHRTPFGIKMGKRSLYYHARNAWLTMIKYAPAKDLARLPWLILTRVLLRGSAAEAKGGVTDATGTIGVWRSIRETRGAIWVLIRASLSVLANLPYCLRHRRPCRAPDFELPLR